MKELRTPIIHSLTCSIVCPSIPFPFRGLPFYCTHAVKVVSLLATRFGEGLLREEEEIKHFWVEKGAFLFDKKYENKIVCRI